MDGPNNIVAAVFWVLGGLGLFLFGIDLMGNSLRKAAGAAMRKGLTSLTRTRFHGLLTGTIATALLQSSSAATVMIVGFISAGLMTFPQSVSLILGANIGSTVTPLITAFDIDQMAIPFVGIGFLCHFMAKKRLWRKLGTALMGFGMLFLGLIIMKFAMKGYSSDIQGWLEASVAGEFWGMLLAFLITMLATAIIQSSAAMVIMIQALAVAGAVHNLEIALPMIMGSHVGTCITAILASLQASKSAKKAAVAHLLFNIIGILITVAAFPLYSNIVPELTDKIALQIAGAHVAMKVVNAILLLPLTKQLAWLTNLFVRGDDKLDATPQHLNTEDISNPVKAFDNVAKEVQRMCRLCMDITMDAVETFFSNDELEQEMVIKREDLTDDLYDSIAEYVLDISAYAMPSDLSHRPTELMQIMNDVERIGDHAENIIELRQAFKQKNVRLSQHARNEIMDMLSLVAAMGDKVIDLFDGPEDTTVSKIMAMHNDIKTLSGKMTESHNSRVRNGECTIIAGIVFSELATNLRRIANHLRNVALILGNEPIKPDSAEI